MSSDEFFEPELETLPRPQLRALQEERLLANLPHIYEGAPFVRELWDKAGVTPRDISSLDDFRERAPFMSKDDIRRFRAERGDPFGGLLASPGRQTTVLSTSGSTGEVTLYAHEWREVHPYWATIARSFWHIGVRPGDVVLGTAHCVRGPMYHAERLCGATTLHVPTVGVGNWVGAEEAIQRFRPVYGQLTGIGVAELDRLSDRYDMTELLSSFKGVGFAGEPLSPGVRAKVEGWGLEVFNWTQCGDVISAWECRMHDGCHAWEDHVLIEAIDPDGSEPVAEGELGELVATSLTDLVTPMVRFRSGDLVRMTTDPCGCGRTHARFSTVGRTTDQTVVGGRAFTPLDISACLEDIRETSGAVFQIVRAGREVERFTLRVGYAPDRTDSVERVRDSVLDRVREKVGVVPDIEMLPDVELLASGRGGKLQRLVTR